MNTDIVSAVNELLSRFIDDHSYLAVDSGAGINTVIIDKRQSLISQANSIVGVLADYQVRINSLAADAKKLQDEEITALGVIIDNVKSGKSAVSKPRPNVKTTPGTFGTMASAHSASNTLWMSTNSQAVHNTHNGQHTGHSNVPNGPSVQATQSAQGTSGANPVARAVKVAQPQRPMGVSKPPQGWTLVQRKPALTDVVKTERVPTPKTLPAIGGGLERIPVTASIVINAIPVKSFADIKCDGNLYYVSTCAHFALMINGMLFHGNIGTIYTDADEPKKIKDCKYVDGCNKSGQCCYYHNPRIFSGSTDRRNYLASSFVYTSATAMHKNRSRSRRFGSLENLDADILGLAEEEKIRMCDQAMHELLCAIILKSLSGV